MKGMRDSVRVVGLGLTFTIVKMLGPNKTYQTQYNLQEHFYNVTMKMF